MSDQNPWSDVPVGREHPEGAPGVLPNVLRSLFGDSDFEIQRAQSAEHHTLHIAQAKAQMERERENHNLEVVRFDRFARLEEAKVLLLLACAMALTFCVCCLIMAFAWEVIS